MWRTKWWSFGIWLKVHFFFFSFTGKLVKLRWFATQFSTQMQLFSWKLFVKLYTWNKLKQHFVYINIGACSNVGACSIMDFIIANVEHLEFKIEHDLNEQYGSLPLPFPGMDSKWYQLNFFIFLPNGESLFWWSEKKAGRLWIFPCS